MARDETAWRARAACQGMDPNLWHPEAGHTADPLAQSICAGCPVREDCLEWALETRQRFGIWGGLSERKRRRILWERNGARPRMARLPRPRKRAG